MYSKNHQYEFQFELNQHERDFRQREYDRYFLREMEFANHLEDLAGHYFAEGDAGQALHLTWSAINESMLWALMFADDGESQEAKMIVDFLQQAFVGLEQAEVALNMRFIPKPLPIYESNGDNDPDSDVDIPF